MKFNTRYSRYRPQRRAVSGTGGSRRVFVARFLGAMLLSGLFVIGAAQAASAGKITVNERVLDVADDASVLIDDDPVTLPELHGRLHDGAGWHSRSVVVGADATLSSGSVSHIEFENNLKGPITSTAPLRVLGQPFTVNGNTALVGFSDVALLTAGQFLEVSGFVDVDSSVVASRVALDDTSPNPWRVSGFLSQYDGPSSTATIGAAPGGQAIAFVGVTPSGCGAGPAVGDYVVAVATPIASFASGDVLNTVTGLSCRPLVPPGALDDHDAFEGLIESVLDPTTFTIGGYTVSVGVSTLFRNGNAGDLDAGVRVEVEGTFTSATTLDARRIKFVLPSVRFRAPVDPADVSAGVSITILGNTVLDNAQDRDEDAIMASGLANPTQVEVRAYMDRLGQLFATRVRSRGGPSSNHYNLQAPAETITRPTLTALGLTIDTTTSTFEDDNRNPITADDFFAAVSVGTLVEIDDAKFDAVNNRLFDGVARLSDDGAAAALHAPAVVATNAKVSGAVTALALDFVFRNGFE